MTQYQNSLQLIFRSTVVACDQKSQKTANLKPKTRKNCRFYTVKRRLRGGDGVKNR